MTTNLSEAAAACGDDFRVEGAPKDAFPSRFRAHEYALRYAHLLRRQGRWMMECGVDRYDISEAEVEIVLAAATRISQDVYRVTNEEVAGANWISFGWVYAEWTPAKGWQYGHRVDRRYANAGRSVYGTLGEAVAEAERCAKADPMYGRPALHAGVGGPHGDDRPTAGY
jgi:hypothetical protein